MVTFFLAHTKIKKANKTKKGKQVTPSTQGA